jgi:hypothetical protein
MADGVEARLDDEEEAEFRLVQRAQVKRLAAAKPSVSAQARRLSRHIGCPLPWLERVYPVARSKGDIVVWLWLWRLRSIRRSRTVKVTNNGLTSLGITRFTKYRALRRFAEAGLIHIRRNGKNALEVAFRAKP